MENVEERAADTAAAMDREARLISEAIALVASGGSRRVVVGGIAFGEVLLDPARRLALQAGVRLVPVWRDDGGPDVAIEAIRE